MANLTFGFWRHLFFKPTYNKLGWGFVRIFDSSIAGSINRRRTVVSQYLTDLNKIRNRICHNDQIILTRNTSAGVSVVDYKMVKTTLQELKDLSVAMCGFYPDKMAECENKIFSLIYTKPAA